MCYLLVKLAFGDGSDKACFQIVRVVRLHIVRKPDFCIYENKVEDELHSRSESLFSLNGK